MLSAFPAFPLSDGLFGVQFPTFDGGFMPWDCQEPLFPSHQHEQALLPNKIPHEPLMSNSGYENSNFNPLYSNSVSDEPNRGLGDSSPGHLFSFPKQVPAISPNETLLEQVITNSGSENSNPNPILSPTGSYEIDRNMDNASPGSDDTNQTGCVLDERKRKRMISNRESARRSRMRKKKHLENMRNQLTWLRIENRELSNRLGLVTHHCQIVRGENDRLQSESAMLRQRLWVIQQVMVVGELQPFSPSAWSCKTITRFNEQNLAS